MKKNISEYDYYYISSTICISWKHSPLKVNTLKGLKYVENVKIGDRSCYWIWLIFGKE